MFTALDVFVGIFVVYLVLSLMVSAGTEWVATLFRLRARTLQTAISRLLDAPGEIATPRLTATQHVTPKAPAKPAQASREFYKHPLITALSSRSHPPSYIPASVFAEVTEDLLAHGVVPKEAPAAAVAESVGVSGGPALRARLEHLFADTMERTTGWYKRVAQTVTVIIGLIVTVLANADTLRITETLWSNRALRESAVALAEHRAAQPIPDAAFAIDAGYPDPANPISDDLPDDRPAPRSAEEIVAASRVAADDRALLTQLLGWGPEYVRINADYCAARERERDATCADPARQEACRRLLDAIAADARCAIAGSHLEAGAVFPGRLFLRPSLALSLAAPHLFGWILTVAAISLGAPFWFDTLNRFLNIRGAGKAPEEPKKGPK